MALVHVFHLLWASWHKSLSGSMSWAPFCSVMGSGRHMSPGGVVYSESSDSDSVSSCLWGCAMCISKFLWTTQVFPSSCHGLIVYTWEFVCCSITSYLVFSQQSPILCFPPNTFCLTNTEITRFKLGGSHFLVILVLMAGRFLVLV